MDTSPALTVKQPRFPPWVQRLSGCRGARIEDSWRTGCSLDGQGAQGTSASYATGTVHAPPSPPPREGLLGSMLLSCGLQIGQTIHLRNKKGPSRRSVFLRSLSLSASCLAIPFQHSAFLPKSDLSQLALVFSRRRSKYCVPFPAARPPPPPPPPRPPPRGASPCLY